IYPEYTGTKRQWSYFKRFTYFVSPSETNKTFLRQIGDGDFSSLQKIKEAFSVDPVTKQFYNELQSWYFWAMDKIKFPEDYKHSNDPAKDKEICNATNLIRLITRIIFIRFLTEKGLVPQDLFSREKLGSIVKDFMNGKKAANFYNAILQNLFFGTLNQKMDERKFADEKGYPSNKKEYGIKNLFRYGDKFLINKNEVYKLFQEIPFLNGGLFDCLDKEDESGKVIYVDGFSRNPAKQSSMPDYLFFQQAEEKADLSGYGLGTNRTARGLIEILNSYNFTIDENTPIDQEIALDPELLGKVFENLLASYNPETATTARKATGSYYTPREIVDYMVGESLVAYLENAINDPARLHQLLSYSDEIQAFSNEETRKIISAIDDIKILDPACGSGAFPMGILHKLVYALQKLDPENKYWHELQYQKALKESEDVFKQDDKNEREERLREINEAFDEGINYPDYARKLYLIENCIYGVDIQPIAIQISKLRFFISLVLDQKVDRSKENLGIRALPNLETKFVAANTLIVIEMPQSIFYTDKIRKLEDEIKSLRHKYFQAKTRREKLDYQKKDRELRGLLAEELKGIGFSSDSSKKIATFDLYDQNASADFFDPEWMFGITDGFDVVIGNPPYVRADSGPEYLAFRKKLEESKTYKTLYEKWDLMVPFIERGLGIANTKGNLIYIVSNAICTSKYAFKLLDLIQKDYFPRSIDYFEDMAVFEAGVIPVVIHIGKIDADDKTRKIIHCGSFENIVSKTDVPMEEFKSLGRDAFRKEYNSVVLKTRTVNLGDICYMSKGMVINADEKTEQSAFVKDDLISEKKTEIHSRPYIEGKDIDLYMLKRSRYLEWGTERVPGKLSRATFPELYDRSKIMRGRVTGGIYDESGLLCNDSIVVFVRFTDLRGVNNKSIQTSIKKFNRLLRTQLEKISEKFDLKYLLAILNSSFALMYLNNIRRHRLENYFYPDDFRKLPIADISPKEQKPFVDLVDQILTAKKKDPNADTSALERQIDEMVYKLYGLTEDEIEIVEGKNQS
ncbi:MAG: Eco57I restriction-modification methylase domain-containing protein, partial [Nitrospirae bacterium]|nr:Eco57I restriction-modification methylase domain-containing protein [Nitrospirota bacterium]